MLKNRRLVSIFFAVFVLLLAARFFYSLEIKNVEFVKLRLFRIVALSLCGAGISICGFVLQNIFKNPIVDIYILGNASICILAQIIAVALFYYPFSYYASYCLSFFLTMAVMYIVYKFSYRKGYFDLVKLLLLSFAVNIFVWGIINFFIYNITKLSYFKIYDILVGTLEGIYLNEVLLISISCITSFILLYILLDKIHILSIGEEFALTTGVNTERLKLQVFVIVSILSTIVTIAFGIIPFIGIVVPHFIRLLIKGRVFLQFILILFAGASTLLFSDFLSLLLSSYFNIPIFILLNLLAFPFFVYLIFRR